MIKLGIYLTESEWTFVVSQLRGPLVVETIKTDDDKKEFIEALNVDSKISKQLGIQSFRKTPMMLRKIKEVWGVE
jgi:hypothetical protein